MLAGANLLNRESSSELTLSWIYSSNRTGLKPKDAVSRLRVNVRTEYIRALKFLGDAWSTNATISSLSCK
jgi:hypothetical protein